MEAVRGKRWERWLRWSTPTLSQLRRAHQIFLRGLLIGLMSASAVLAQFPGQGEVAPPDISAPVVGDNGWGIEQQTYIAQSQAQTPEYPTNYENQLFTAMDVRNIVREELNAYEQSKVEDPAGHVIGSDLGMTGAWNHGMELSTKAKDFRIHVGGRTQFDVGWFDADPNVNNNINVPYGDGVDFRRARLRVDGTMYEVIEFACEYDFINGARVRNSADTGPADLAVTAPTDLWLQIKQLPLVGNCRIGNHKEAIGFEHLVSSRFLPFMERSFNQDTFYGGAFNGFSPGISFFNTYGEEEMGTWNIGVYKPCNSVFAFNNNDGDYAVTARLTRLLWYVDDGRGLLHVGVSGRQSSTVGDQIVFRTRPSIRTGISTVWPTPANTGTLFGDDMQWLNSEVAAVYGSWTFQAEYLLSGLQDARAAAADPSLGNAQYHGGYVQLMYFLTGESDHYDKKTGAFGRVIPNENFFRVRDESGGLCRGRGAWQFGVRYNHLDVNDLGLNGGVLHDVTAGLNWFLNPNSKLQFNYSALHRDAPLAGGLGDGWVYSWGGRLAFDF